MDVDVDTDNLRNILFVCSRVCYALVIPRHLRAIGQCSDGVSHLSHDGGDDLMQSSHSVRAFHSEGGLAMA